MTEYILITMLCIQSCKPQWAEVMPDKETCEKHIIVKKSLQTFCFPRIKDKIEKKLR